MPFVKSNLPGISFAVPDVCKTPTPVGPIPIPYPNIAISVMAIPNQFRTLITVMPAHNMLTMIPMTNGDNPGVAMGVASQMVMGPQRSLKGSAKLFIGALPATRSLIDPTGHNGLSPNTVGTEIVPMNFRVLSLG